MMTKLCKVTQWLIHITEHTFVIDDMTADCKHTVYSLADCTEVNQCTTRKTALLWRWRQWRQITMLYVIRWKLLTTRLIMKERWQRKLSLKWISIPVNTCWLIIAFSRCNIRQLFSSDALCRARAVGRVTTLAISGDLYTQQKVK